jgi:hypothetical protein
MIICICWCTVQLTMNIDRMEPIIYETVVLCHPFQPGRSYHWAVRRTRTFLRTINLSKRAQHLAMYIRNLFLDIHISPLHAERVLLLSTNLVSLAYWATGRVWEQYPTSFFTHLRTHQLDCLSINTRNLDNTWDNIDLSNSIFANLSHLDLVNDRVVMLELPNLHLLPSLTHLAVHGWTSANSLKRALWLCKTLRVLVLRKAGDGGELAIVDDSRLVVMESHYWSNCNMTLWNIWTCAEYMIMQREAVSLPAPSTRSA